MFVHPRRPVVWGDILGKSAVCLFMALGGGMVGAKWGRKPLHGDVLIEIDSVAAHDN